MRAFFTTPHAATLQPHIYIDEILAILKKYKVTVSSESEIAPGSWSPPSSYSFVIQSIAEADIVVVEASYEDFRIGHEVTLALLYGKPTLVLSQKMHYSGSISHELLFAKQYQTKRELRKVLEDFIRKTQTHLSPLQKSTQSLGQAADALHAAALSPLRHNALRDQTEFGEWARLAEKDPEKACKKVIKTLGNLPVQPAWSVFAPIYNEDTPDYIFMGAAGFAHAIFTNSNIPLDGLIVDVDTKTGSLARNLSALGYSHVVVAESSREMLAEVFRLCAHLPTIKIIESTVPALCLPKKADAITWMDYSSNFALTPRILQEWLENLLENIRIGGRLLFDVRTSTGWNVTFFRQKISTVSTPHFQRVSIRDFDQANNTVRFDRFIRTKNIHSWGEWRREQMSERIWTLSEVKTIVSNLSNGQLEAIYDDNFARIGSNIEPGIAYIELKRRD